MTFNKPLAISTYPEWLGPQVADKLHDSTRSCQIEISKLTDQMANAISSSAYAVAFVEVIRRHVDKVLEEILPRALALCNEIDICPDQISPIIRKDICAFKELMLERFPALGHTQGNEQILSNESSQINELVDRKLSLFDEGSDTLGNKIYPSVELRDKELGKESLQSRSIIRMRSLLRNYWGMKVGSISESDLVQSSAENWEDNYMKATHTQLYKLSKFGDGNPKYRAECELSRRITLSTMLADLLSLIAIVVSVIALFKGN